MKANHTHKLFFRKYAYKATIRCPRVAVIRYPDHQNLTFLSKAETFGEYCNLLRKTKQGFLLTTWDNETQHTKRLWEARFLIFKILSMKEKLLNQGVSFTLRLESDTCGFYTNDAQSWNEVCRMFKDNIIDICWPKDNKHLNYLLTNPTNEIVKDYPYQKYQYRINLRSVMLPNSLRENFREWVNSYNDVKISDITINTVEKGGYTLNGKFLYSTNKKMMLLLQMYLGNAIKDITEFKLEKEL